MQSVKKILIFGSVLFISSAFGQTPKTETWFSIQLPVALSPKWQWHNDAGYRTIGSSLNLYQYLYRTGVRKIITKNWSAATGVAFFSTRASYQKENHVFGNEFRIWHEINHQQMAGGSANFQNRLRIEERFFQQAGDEEAYNALRLRYRTGITQKLTSNWSMQIADEYMQQLSKADFNFNQNRLMFSVIRTIKQQVQLQAGYMWLLRSNSSQHILTIAFQKIIELNGNRDN